ISLSSFDKQTVLDLLKKSGFVLFRGFDLNLDTFSSFVRANSSRVSLDPARTFSGDVAQKVDAGYDPVGLHCENGNSPFLPDLCWFYCQKAASAGSQTTVCDGYRVWDSLSESTRKAFSEQKIMYTRYVEKEKWQKMAFHLMQGKKPQENITYDDLLALLNGSTHTTSKLLEEDAIEYAFTVGAAHSTLFDDRLSFANSLLGPSYNYQKPRITFADGSAIPDSIMAEVAEVSERMTENLEWQDGDMVLIDNTRLMHGRRAIIDPHRTIFNALSYVN
ncbi:MAG: Taurine catabolism dioxygenase TauD, partial [Pseudomonadota bacterium]